MLNGVIFIYSVTNPVETYKYIEESIVDSYERDMINGDAESRSHWVSYALGTTANAVVGTKGVGALRKTGVATTKTAVQKSVTTVPNMMNTIQSSRLAQFLPYWPRTQVALPEGVAFNVINGPVLKENLFMQSEKLPDSGGGLKGPVKGFGKGKSFGKYSTKIEDKVKVIKKVDLPDWISEPFIEGNNRTVITGENITFYRTYGDSAKANGGFVTTRPAGNRINAKINTALVPDWKRSRQYEAVIEVRKG